MSTFARRVRRLEHRLPLGNPLPHHPQNTLLVIDDDPLDVIAVKRAANKVGWPGSVVGAGDAQAGLELLRSIPPDRVVVLLDVNMPRMGGFELLKIVRDDPVLRSTTVFVLSTSNNPADVERAHELKVADYLVKPTGSQAMQALLRRVWTYTEASELYEQVSGAGPTPRDR